MKRLYKCRKEAKIEGVCAGIAKYINLDVTVVRLLFLIWGFSGGGIIAYILACIIMPDKPNEKEDTDK